MDRLAQTLQRMKGQQLSVHTLERPTPLCPAADETLANG